MVVPWPPKPPKKGKEADFMYAEEADIQLAATRAADKQKKADKEKKAAKRAKEKGRKIARKKQEKDDDAIFFAEKNAEQGSGSDNDEEEEEEEEEGGSEEEEAGSDDGDGGGADEGDSGGVAAEEEVSEIAPCDLFSVLFSKTPVQVCYAFTEYATTKGPTLFTRSGNVSASVLWSTAQEGYWDILEASTCPSVVTYLRKKKVMPASTTLVKQLESMMAAQKAEDSAKERGKTGNPSKASENVDDDEVEQLQTLHTNLAQLLCSRDEAINSHKKDKDTKDTKASEETKATKSMMEAAIGGLAGGLLPSGSTSGSTRDDDDDSDGGSGKRKRRRESHGGPATWLAAKEKSELRTADLREKTLQSNERLQLQRIEADKQVKLAELALRGKEMDMQRDHNQQMMALFTAATNAAGARNN